MNFNFQPSNPRADLSADLTALLDSSYKASKDAEPKRPYLGASIVGHHCERYLGYSFHGVQVDEGAGFSGQTYRIFDMGHDGETRMAQYLRTAGFTLLTEKEDGGQFGFYAAEGAFRGHIDGVLTAGPLPLPYACGWENKAVGDKKWNEFRRSGVRVASPTYYGQIQVYCAYLELPGFLFTAINRDDATVYAEYVPLDPAAAQQLSDKAVRVITSSRPEELPRCTTDQADFRCKFCDFRVRCWTVQERSQAFTAAAPSWLKRAS
jgi:hypothetical protein